MRVNNIDTYADISYMEFSDQIRQWVSLDNQLKTLNDRAKELRAQKNAVSEEIIQYVDTHNLNNSVVKISDGRLRFTETTQHSPLTFKHVEDCLKKCIQDEGDVKKIMKLIKDTRQAKSVSDIKRTYVEASSK